MNRVTLVGRLGRDPELVYTESGIALTKFSLAVTRQYKNAAGERESDWFNIVCWRTTAEFCANYLTKGRLVSVDGRLQSRKYTTKEGDKREAVEVVAEYVSGLDKPKETNPKETKPEDEDELDPFSEE